MEGGDQTSGVVAMRSYHALVPIDANQDRAKG